MEGDAVDLQQFAGRTFERDGERCLVQCIHASDCYVTVEWDHNDDTAWQQVPKAMLKLWLAGAVEVKGEGEA